MKSNNLYILSVLVALCFSLLFSACSDPEMPLNCDAEALFLREEATGRMVYLTCYDSWAVRLDETNEEGIQLIAASREISESLRVDSTRVILDACFYEFDMELLYPDPAPWGDLYVIRDFEISTDL